MSRRYAGHYIGHYIGHYADHHRQPVQGWQQCLTTGLCTLLLLAAGLIPPVAADTAGKTTAVPAEKVIVETVEAWQQGIETALYCVVATPFVYQLASHGEAELIQRLPVGTVVEKGQLVAEQDGFYLSTDIAIKKVDIKLARATRQYAEDEFNRLGVLTRQGMASAARQNDLKLQLQQSKLSQQRLAQQLDALNNRFVHLRHYAPFAAQVMAVDAQPGQQLEQGDNILRLLPIGQKQLECKLPLNLYHQAGDISQLGFIFSGQQLVLRELSRQLDQSSQNVTLFFDYPQGPQTTPLLIGQRIQLSMQQPAVNATRVPYDALKLDGEQYSVWMVDQADKAVKVKVKILATSSSHFVVASSLKQGDRVVVRGFSRLKTAQKVMPINKAKLSVSKE